MKERGRVELPLVPSVFFVSQVYWRKFMFLNVPFFKGKIVTLTETFKYSKSV